MFLSAHDLGALVVLLVSAGTVACSTALLLGARVARSGDALLTATRRLGETEPPPGPGQPGNPPDESAPLEFTRVAHELEATSARLDEARRRERALEASRRELIAWISHDLRTPLAGIRAIAEALEDGLAADDYTLDRYHETLRLEADRLSGLVDDLFELSRAQQGMIRLEWERVSLRDLVSDAIAGISPIAEAKGVTIEGRVREQQPELRVSPPELLRALRNILENAVRHTPSDGSVVVEAGLEGTDAIVSIVDTGGGIADADMDRVFDVGFRADPARTPGEGAGLGLAIARELVKAHDGDISVRNQNGGAQFVVRLPVEGSSG
jgi:signal transduction histidine kinase